MSTRAESKLSLFFLVVCVLSYAMPVAAEPDRLPRAVASVSEVEGTLDRLEPTLAALKVTGGVLVASASTALAGALIPGPLGLPVAAGSIALFAVSAGWNTWEFYQFKQGAASLGISEAEDVLQLLEIAQRRRDSSAPQTDQIALLLAKIHAGARTGFVPSPGATLRMGEANCN